MPHLICPDRFMAEQCRRPATVINELFLTRGQVECFPYQSLKLPPSRQKALDLAQRVIPPAVPAPRNHPSSFKSFNLPLY